MRRILGALAALVLVLAVAGGATLALIAVVGGGLGCPLALVEGTLVDADGTLAVESDYGDNTVVTVHWPLGYGVSDDAGTLVLTHLFSPVAREGDHVAMGGSSGDDGTFTACGPIAVRPSGASPSPSGTPAPTPEVEEARVLRRETRPDTVPARGGDEHASADSLAGTVRSGTGRGRPYWP
jgi:hypothetical protein